MALTLAAGLLGCSLLPGSEESEPGIHEVNVAASPTPGMRLSYQVQIIATLSGSGVSSLTDAQKTASNFQRYVLEVTSVEGDAFDVRITGAGLEGPVIARFERDWTPVRFGVEREGKYTDADLPTFPILGEAFQTARDLSGRWTVGQSRPWERSVTIPPLLSVLMKGTVTLKRVARLDGRRVAVFEYAAAGEGEYMGSRLAMKLSGQHWVDLATGFTLVARTSVPGNFTQGGQAIRMELKDERTVSRPESSGL